MNCFEYLKLFCLIKDIKHQRCAGNLLIEHQKRISVAESCTGGLLSSLMTDISGSSDYIHANFVTYANEAKMKYLGVKSETLDKYGAVSVQTANEMVSGLIEKTGADFAIATTGIAGPTGGSTEKSVGLVYIGVGSANNIEVHKYNVNPNYPRELVKYMFAKQAIRILANYLKLHIEDGN